MPVRRRAGLRRYQQWLSEWSMRILLLNRPFSPARQHRFTGTSLSSCGCDFSSQASVPPGLGKAPVFRGRPLGLSRRTRTVQAHDFGIDRDMETLGLTSAIPGGRPTWNWPPVVNAVFRGHRLICPSSPTWCFWFRFHPLHLDGGYNGHPIPRPPEVGIDNQLLPAPA